MEQTYKFDSKFDKNPSFDLKIKHQTGSEIQRFNQKKYVNPPINSSGQYKINKFKNFASSPRYDNPLTIL